jgi:hypothetical protein
LAELLAEAETAAWRGSVVTTLLVGARKREELRQVAEIVLETRPVPLSLRVRIV